MENPLVLIETSSGDVLLELYANKVPETVKNFMQYVEEHFYDNTIFHRVMPGFMIQGGGLTCKKEEKNTHPPIQNEADKAPKNTRGTIAMARTQDIDSASAQFFINLVDNDFLDHQDDSPEGFGYCVFGHVVEGLEVVDAIAKIKTKPEKEHEAMPIELVVITRISPFV